MPNRLFERYLQRNPVKHSLAFPEGIGLIVIIPVLDDPDIFNTLDSLCFCTIPEKPVGVVVLVNHSEQSDAEVVCRNLKLAEQLKTVMPRKEFPGLHFQLLEIYDMPMKYAGVGLARKMAMDAVVEYFYGMDNRAGVIVSLDADTDVERNYFTEITRLFEDTQVAGVSIAYEHRLPKSNAVLREAIVCYELYLRYYRQALCYSGHPYYYHCIGSAFAVRAVDYVAQGGMNRRQAGEDFYFLQKLMATGRYGELMTTTVYPSARVSSRTPFGTGRSVMKIIENRGVLLTYDFQAFRDLKCFFEIAGGLYRRTEETIAASYDMLPESLCGFLSLSDFVAAVVEINGNCASEKQFKKRFFDYFNAFQVLKFLNQSHGMYFVKQTIEAVARELLGEYVGEVPTSREELLAELKRVGGM